MLILIIKSIKSTKLFLLFFNFLLCILFGCILSTSFFNASTLTSSIVWDDKLIEKNSDYIKWVDFTPTYEVLSATSKLDINSHNSDSEIKYNWIELISYLACKYGGNFKNYKTKDLNALIDKLNSGTSIEDLTKDMKYYSYYYEAYDAVLHEFIGAYQIEIINSSGETEIVDKYGIKAFSPIARNYNFSHYDDFGASRSYGYKRTHLGNDLMGNIGTPIIAVESGTIEAIGWNQYGGWRIGIRSFDGKRYYYYAHLRKDHPYVDGLEIGSVVRAGDVVGYLGMTGYSTTENVNNINVPHLHFGIQLIFNECQKDGVNQIWIDVYQIIEFLRKNTSEVHKTENNNYVRKFQIFEPNLYEI